MNTFCGVNRFRRTTKQRIENHALTVIFRFILEIILRIIEVLSPHYYLRITLRIHYTHLSVHWIKKC